MPIVLTRRVVGRRADRGGHTLLLYLYPIGWLALLSGALLGTLSAHVVGLLSRTGSRMTVRRLLHGALVFLPLPLLVEGPSGPVAVILYLLVITIVLGRQGYGPIADREEFVSRDLPWSSAIARGIAFAAGGLLGFLLALDVGSPTFVE